MSLLLLGFLFFSTNLKKKIVIIGKKMEQLFQNENRSLEIFMNEVERNNEPFEKRSFFFSNPQIKSNKTSQIEKEKKKSLNNCMLKEKYGGFIFKI
jgi:hypothetical protein